MIHISSKLQSTEPYSAHNSDESPPKTYSVQFFSRKRTVQRRFASSRRDVQTLPQKDFDSLCARDEATLAKHLAKKHRVHKQAKDQDAKSDISL